MKIKEMEDHIVYYLKNVEKLVKGNKIPKELKSLYDILSYLKDENSSFCNSRTFTSYCFISDLIFHGKLLNTDNLLFNSFSHLYSIYYESIIIQENNFEFNYFLDRFLVFLNKINYEENEENYVTKIEKFLKKECIEMIVRRLRRTKMILR